MYERHGERRSDARKWEDWERGHAFPFEHLSSMIVIEVLCNEIEY